MDIVKDIGVLMSSDGSFGNHVNKIYKTARSIFSWILRAYKPRLITPMLKCSYYGDRWNCHIRTIVVNSGPYGIKAIYKNSNNYKNILGKIDY